MVALMSPHIPVLLDEILDIFAPVTGKYFIDGTFGAGGYSKGLLEAGARCVIAVDRDPNTAPFAENLAKMYGNRFIFVPGCFSEMDSLVSSRIDRPVDGIVLDIGVSSMQLDDASRGFSFMLDGPLDMRMGSQQQSAADIINHFSLSDLARIFRIFGEEKQAMRHARAIVAQRAITPFTTTHALAELIARNSPGANRQKIHPATRIFQALRIYVNNELEELASGLDAAERLLPVDGKLAVVSFHSLEDRIVKRFFAHKSGTKPTSRHLPAVNEIAGSFGLITRKAITASSAEIGRNPRSRSARLRAGKRLEAIASHSDFKALGVPVI